MHYYFEDTINVTTVNDLIEKLEGKDNITLYFSTEGGDISPMICLIDFFNSLEENIEIVLTDALISAGTMLLTDYKGKLRQEGLDFILFHKWDRLVYTLRKSSLVDESVLIEQTANDNIKFAKKLKELGLNKKQIKQFNNGKNVILYKDSFKQLGL